MKKFYLPICFVLCTLAAPVAAQIHLEGYRQADIAPQWLDGRWTAQWISVPGEPQNAYGIYHFRKTFELPEQPERFVVHVSADNRYKLYVNGELASVGPARGDVFNWNFETVDLARWLKPGKNTLAAVVWNFAEMKPVAQVSFNQTGLIVQATQRPKRPSIRTTVGCAATTTPTNRTRRASTVIMPQDRASRSTRPPTPGAGKRPDSTTRHGTKRRPA